MFNYSHDDVAGYNEGDIIKLQGKRFFLEKKTSRMIKIRRYFWWDDLAAWVIQKLGGA